MITEQQIQACVSSPNFQMLKQDKSDQGRRTRLYAWFRSQDPTATFEEINSAIDRALQHYNG